MKKRMGSLLLALVMCLSLLPAPALAATGTVLTSTVSKQAVMLGTGSPLGFDAEAGYNGTYDELYFGTFYTADEMAAASAEGGTLSEGSPHLWRILDGQTSVESGGLFLLSTDTYTNVRFTLPREVEGENWWTQPHNKWDSPLCAARLWCGELAKSDKVFSDAERGALLAVSKADERYTPTSFSYFQSEYGKVLTGKLDNEKIFYLSAKEFEDPRYGLTENGGSIGTYPLRSQADGATYTSEGETIYDGYIASGSNVVMVLPTYGKLFTGTTFSPELTATEKFFLGSISDFGFFPGFGSGSTENYAYQYNEYVAHPAMNLSGDKVLYITAADNSGHQSYGTVADASTNWKWKTVLTDSNAAFKGQVSLTNAPTNNLINKTGYTMAVSHPALSTLSGYDVITASLADGDGKLIRYGTICTDQNTTSTNVEIPAGLDDGVYTLRITAEKRNGEKRSDVAAQPFVAEIKVASAHSHPVCGIANCEDTAHGEHDSVSWTPITTTAELAAMTADSYCFLIGNVEAPATDVVGHLCVNGYTVTGTLKAGTAAVNGETGLTLCGCKGRTEVAKVVVADGAVFDQYGLDLPDLTVGAGSTLNMYSGSDGKGERIRSVACTKDQIGENAKLNLYRGYIGPDWHENKYWVRLPKGCQVNVYQGGELDTVAMQNEDASVTVHDGGSVGPAWLEANSILTVKNGGSISCVDYAAVGTTINLYRCTIPDPNVSGASRTIESKGTVNLYGAVNGGAFRVDRPLNICANLGAAPDEIPTIYMNNTADTQTWVASAFTSGWAAKMGNADGNAYFKPEIFGYGVSADTTGELHCGVMDHVHPVCGATCTHSGSDAHQNVTWQKVSKWSEFGISGTTLNGGNYCLMKNVTKSGKGGTITISGNVNICLDGFTLNLNEACFDLQSGATLTICDCRGSGNTGKVTKGKGDRGRAVNVPQNAAFNLYGGELSDNSSAATLADGAKGGAVRVTGGTFTMYGGKISEGVAVEMTAGSFHFKDGTLASSSWREGAAVWQTGGTAAMTGGTISAYAPLSISGGRFTMSGGSMSAVLDPATVSGSGTFQIDGGTLTAEQGAVKISGGTVNMTGGRVDSHARTAMTVDGGAFTMSGGVIDHQETDGYNPVGVTLTSGSFTMSGGEIKDYQIGVEVNGGTMTVSGAAKIKDNGPVLYGRVYPKNVVLASGKTITVGAMGDGAQIGITKADRSGGVFSAGGKDYAASFRSDVLGYSVSASDNNLQLSGTATPAPTVTKILVGDTEVAKDGVVTLEVGESVPLSAVLDPANAEYWWYHNPMSDGRATELDDTTGTVTAKTPHEKDNYKDTYRLVYDGGRESVRFYIHVIEPTSHTVTYNMQGHGAQIAPLEADVNATITAPPAPTETGYTFGGWYKDAACTQAWSFGTDKVTADMTLYAKWTAKSYTMTLNANGGACDQESVTLTFGQACSALPTPTRGGHTFGGWYDAGNNKLEVTTTLNTDYPETERTLTAHWTPIPATAPTVTKGSDLTLTYGYANAGSISVTATAASGHSLAYQWYICNASGEDANAIQNATGSSLSIGTGRSAGTYHYYCAVTATRGDNQQTATANSGVITVTVSKAARSATVSMNGYTYGGTVSIPGVSANPENGTVTYYYSTENANSGGTEWKNIEPTTLNAGTYYLYATIGATANYGAFTTPAVSFTVGKATPTVTWPTLDAIYVNDTLADGDLKNGSGAGTFSITGTKTWATSGSGITTVTFTPTDTVNYDTLTNSNIAVTVNKRTVEEITTTIPTAITDKDYGTELGDLGLPTQVDILASGNKTFTVPVSWSGYDPHVLTEQTLTGTLILNAIADEVTQPTTAITATTTVKLKELTAGDVTFEDKTETYTGNPISHTIATLPTGVASAAYTYAGTGETVYASSPNAPTDAGTYTVTVTFTMQPGYAQKENASAKLTINKAAGSVTAPTAVASLTYNGEAQTLIRAGSSTTGTVQYRLGSGDYGTTLPAAKNADTYTVYYKVVGDRNHEDVAERSIPVTIARQSVTVPAADTTQFTYNGAAQTYTVAKNALYTVSGNEQTVAGTHTVSVTLKNPTNYVWSDGTDTPQTFDFVIDPATVTITVADKSVYMNSTAPDLSAPVLGEDYTVDGLLGDDALLTAPTLRYDPEPDMGAESDTTLICASGADAGDNYTIEYVDGKLTITRRPVPATSGKHHITVDDAENGSVTVDPSGAREGETVTITVKPDAGYAVEDITITDRNGNKVKFTRKGDKYTFEMPETGVTVKVEFAKSGNPFVDVPEGKYFYDAVLWAVESGITGGTDATHFSPYASCTRGQLVTFLWRAAGCPAAKDSKGFSDVEKGRYCEAAVAWAAENEIVGGYDDGTFRPDATITRQQTAAILWRFAKYAGMDVTVGEDTNILSFNDALAISDYAFPAIQWAVGAEVMGGSNGSLLPGSICNRAQIVTMLYRSIAK